MKKIITLSLFLALPFLTRGQLQNMNFEQWQNDPTTITDGMQNKPVGWTWSNSSFDSDINMFYYLPETNAQDGEYALKLGIWYNYDKDAAKQTAPINSRPIAVTGHYKYTDNELLDSKNVIIKDTAQVSIYLTKWNEALSQNDTIGRGKINLSESINYSTFTCTVNYISDAMPDKVTLFLDCSKLRRDDETEGLISVNNTGAFFTVDNLSLIENTMGNEDFNLSGKVKLYPNPATDSVTLTNFSGDVSFYDITGKQVLTQFVTIDSPINVQHLQNGVYSLKLTEGNTITYLKLVKN